MKTKNEAARLAADRFDQPDPTEVCDLLEEWLSTNPENVSLQGEPVVLSHVLKDKDIDSDIEVICFLNFNNNFLLFHVVLFKIVDLL